MHKTTTQDTVSKDLKPGRQVLAPRPQLDIPALYVHDLTGTSEAERLLNRPAPVHPRSSYVLPNLEKFNPNLAAKLLAKDDTVKQMPFRLITTSPHWTPKTINSFVAMSYCWHGDDWHIPPRFGCTDPEWEFPICPATLKAILLRHDSKSKTTNEGNDFAMWVDQICISQADPLEKFHAVANMDTISRNASEVEILLEDLDFTEEEEIVFSILHGTDISKEPDPYIHVHNSNAEDNLQACFDAGKEEALFTAMCKTFNTRWFTRAWCRHEYMLSRARNFIIAGRRSTCIVLGANIFVDIATRLERQNDEFSLYVSHPAFPDFTFGIHSTNKDYTVDGSFVALFSQLQRLECTFQRDVISIALNTTGIHLSVSGEVENENESKYMLAMIALSAGDASVLGALGKPMENLSCPGHQAPIYWPRDYISDCSYMATSLTLMGRDSKIYRIARDNITLNAFLLKSLPSSPLAHHQEDAVLLCSLIDLGQATHLKVLACAFSLGPEWLRATSAYHSNFAYHGSDFQKRLGSILKFNLHGKGTIESIFGGVSSRIAEFIHTLAHCYVWLPGLRLAETTTAMTITLGSTTSGKKEAIVIVPKTLADKVRKGEYKIAIPVALRGQTALPLLRVWFLEPARTKSRDLALVGRGFLIEANPLSAEKMTHVGYAKKLTVFGKWKESPDGNESSSGEDFDEEDGIEDQMSRLDIQPIQPSESTGHRATSRRATT